MKLLAISRLTNDELGKTVGFIVWIEDEGKYQRVKVNADDTRELMTEVPVKDFRDYDHFVGVIGKFNPYYDFLREPIEIAALVDFETLEDRMLEVERKIRKG